MPYLGLFNSCYKGLKMYFTSEELAKSLNVSVNYLYKVFNGCGLMKRDNYTLVHLEFVIKAIDIKNYRNEVFVLKLKKIVNDSKVTL